MVGFCYKQWNLRIHSVNQPVLSACKLGQSCLYVSFSIFCLAVKHKCFLSLYLQVCMSACRPLCPVCLWITLSCLPMDNYVLSPVLYAFMLILSPVVYVILSLLYSIFCFRLSFYIKGEHANFCVSPQITDPQILGLVPQLQIRKFLRCASPQISNPQICND